MIKSDGAMEYTLSSGAMEYTISRGAMEYTLSRIALRDSIYRNVLEHELIVKFLFIGYTANQVNKSFTLVTSSRFL